MHQRRKKDAGIKDAAKADGGIKDAAKADGGIKDAERRRDKLCLTDIFSRGNFQFRIKKLEKNSERGVGEENYDFPLFRCIHRSLYIQGRPSVHASIDLIIFS